MHPLANLEPLRDDAVYHLVLSPETRTQKRGFLKNQAL